MHRPCPARPSSEMPDFSDFDSRGYRTVDVRTGYGEWTPSYECTVQDAMDIALLDALTTPPWPSLREAAALVPACLVDEHLPDLGPPYREAFRLARPGGYFVVVGYHPHFIMVSRMPT